MTQSTIDSLREALKFSPENVPLRLHLAETLFNLNRLEEAEKEYLEALGIEQNDKALIGLAKVYYRKEAYATCNVILEDLMKSQPDNLDVLVLYTRSSLKENAWDNARETYQRLLEHYPNFSDEELDAQLRVRGQQAPFSEDEAGDDEISLFMQKPDINFSDVSGMEQVKKEIEIKIIQPLRHPELYKAYGKKIGGSILLYGPPGCGKTMIAKATAGQVNAKFINVGLNDILDMWLGNSEKNLHKIFEYARKNTPCVLFFDEIDALGASRADMKQSAGRNLINQFLQELDGVENDNTGILILGATNIPWHLDPAFRRPGRFDRMIFVPPPDQEARTAMLRIKLKDKPIENIDYEGISKITPEFSGADIAAVIDMAIEEKLEASFLEGAPLPLKTKDLQNAAKKHKASTREWFSIAKNFALYANDAGLYDDILHYMKIKK
ncbi:AAA family ATPase [Chitinophaga sp. GCM10012297]|uniref:AAA family ATPase n=1 Tax=Chitinophaga chungangae TaxID=2821488 RepID=A0ABS3YBG1_9BACT|nr:AAA family ATPase [Chitinophaga chungangae]MBO9152017.1 AAA family ATPase [Chitinophaga chungangae]